MSHPIVCTTSGILGLFVARRGGGKGAVVVRKSAPAARPSLMPVEDARLHLFVRQGLPFQCAENVAGFLEMPMARLYELMSVSPSTAHRRKGEQVLSSMESDRLARIARVTAEACRVFGDPDTARRWLGRGHALLGGRAPLDLLDTDAGAGQVADELTRIEFGELAA